MGEMGCLGGEIKDLLRIRKALVPLREPAGRPGDGEEHGEHAARDAQRAPHDPRVEVDVRVELSLDEVLVLERDLRAQGVGLHLALLGRFCERLLGLLVHLWRGRAREWAREWVREGVREGV